MVYRAERLYEATSDAQKIFKFIAQHIYDTAQFEEVLAAKQNLIINAGDEKFLKKREHIIRRLIS